jgi:hypothetical protein
LRGALTAGALQHTYRTRLRTNHSPYQSDEVCRDELYTSAIPLDSSACLQSPSFGATTGTDSSDVHPPLTSIGIEGLDDFQVHEDGKTYPMHTTFIEKKHNRLHLID